ncbi:hypothetical protein EDD94_5026 [Streptomyces sp. PanSC9]|nr:hypothetical protein EDD94_5026 [Streptomyces sp. PanSC9]
MTTQQRPPECHVPPAGSRPQPAGGKPAEYDREAGEPAACEPVVGNLTAADLTARQTPRERGTGGAPEADRSAATAPHTPHVRPASGRSAFGIPHVR